MTSWQHLFEVALLGTGKKSLQPELLVEEIRNLEMKDGASTEEDFLRKVALTFFYNEAGKIPPQLKQVPDISIINETGISAPETLNAVLFLIEKLNSRIAEPLIDHCLDALIAKNYVVSPEAILKLLGNGNNYNETIRNKIIKVIGQKGALILPIFPGFKFIGLENRQQLWNEGTFNERKALLSDLLKDSAVLAVETLQSTWEQESVTNKRAFLEIISENISEPIVGFADSLYRDEFAFSQKEKKTEKECRRILSAILLSSGTTELHRFTKEKLTAGLQKEKRNGFMKFLAAKPKATYRLPYAEDSDFWNSPTMERLYGFDSQAYDISKFNTIIQHWLSEMLLKMPAKIWLDAGIETYAELVDCFLSDERFQIKSEGKSRPVFFSSLLHNALFYCDQKLSAALIPKIHPETAVSLLKNLSDEEYLQYVKANDLYADAKVLSGGPYSLESNWPFAFSEKVIRRIFEVLAQSSNSNIAALVGPVGMFAPTESKSLLDDFCQHSSSGSHFSQWKSNFYDPVVQIFEIRKSINYYK